MNNKKFTVYLPVLLALILLAGILLGLKLGHGISLAGKRSDNKLNDVINFVAKYYVDPEKKDVLQEKAITGMLQSLDPHSVYISASDFHEATDPLMGSFEGIGVQFRIEQDSITVITPVSGGPSEKVGIRAGDRIVTIDGKNVAGIKITNTDVFHKLKGKKGTTVKVGIFRRGVHGITEYTIVRDVIPTYSVDIAYMATQQIGYIRLSNFSAKTHEGSARCP